MCAAPVAALICAQTEAIATESAQSEKQVLAFAAATSISDRSLGELFEAVKVRVEFVHLPYALHRSHAE